MNASQPRIYVRGPLRPVDRALLTEDALAFVAALTRTFREQRNQLLAARTSRQDRFDRGGRPDFLPQTKAIRDADWKVAPVPEELHKRTVEITGPVDRKMVINALNSGADVFMADFEDSNAPTWTNCLDGQLNLLDANRRTLTFEHPTKGTYTLHDDELAVLFVRPRGWHLNESHLYVDGFPVPASLFDFGIYIFHNAALRLAQGSGSYFYLPKLESHLEARLWNDVFVAAQHLLGLPHGTIKATVLIETLPAAFEMDEILWELRDHSAGLNCGRWDYIFSFIKTFKMQPDMVMPDRSGVGMTQPFMEAYTNSLIRICHRRGAHAMGGMAAQIPIKQDPQANQQALDKVYTDKLREATNGHDGTWVAHPGLVSVARSAFEQVTTADNQVARQRPDALYDQEALTKLPTGPRTEAGLRLNIRVGIQYLEAWLRGVGCVPLYHLMEDAATAEISRTAVWQWLRHGVDLDDGRICDRALFDACMADELAHLEVKLGARFSQGRFTDAAALFTNLCTSTTFTEFLTLPAYEQLITLEESP